jgi:hypothetical protein
MGMFQLLLPVDTIDATVPAVEVTPSLHIDPRRLVTRNLGTRAIASKIHLAQYKLNYFDIP